MLLQHRPFVAALLLAIVQAPPAHAEEPAMPRIQAGDTWVYRWTTENIGWPARTFRREVVAVRADEAGNWIVAERSAEALPKTVSVIAGVVDGHGCLVDIGWHLTLQPSPCPALAKVGDSWTMPVNADKSREVTVLGSERITVPAGTFETLRLEATERALAVSPDRQDATLRLGHAVLWFAPAAGAVVRAERDTRLGDGKALIHSVEVLESITHPGAGHVSTNRLAAPVELGSHAPKIILSPDCQPKYPPAAVRALVVGLSRVRIAVDPDGHVTDAELIGASGTTREHGLLDDAARQSLMTCHFKPATTESGAPMAAMSDVQYSWILR